MTNQYETTMILTPVLSDEDVKKTIDGYVDFLTSNGAEIVEKDFWGLKQLAYPIKKKTTGIFNYLEFKGSAELIDKLELSYRRDENILRFLTIKVEKYAAIYNDNKRKGLVGRNKKKKHEPKPRVEEPVGSSTTENSNTEEKTEEKDGKS
ncbi:MAG: 30S ribosomal protein S6 [Chitinophagales bacterium]|nr:30S ribosomal protein S6 [Chitinophagales bacterium]